MGLWQPVRHGRSRNGRRARLERDLKALAVEVLADGAPVVDLEKDAVPLVAVALNHARLPVGSPVDPTLTEERANDAVLRHANDLSVLSPDDRATLLILIRLAFVLGVAQRYAEQLELTHLRT